MSEHEQEIRDKSAETLKRTRDNNLAYAAANRWINTHDDDRMAAYRGGYSGELFKWLVTKYFKKACAGEIWGTFDVSKGYTLDRFEAVSVPQWMVDSWMAKESERKECRSAINRGGSGFKRIGSAVG